MQYVAVESFSNGTTKAVHGPFNSYAEAVAWLKFHKTDMAILPLNFAFYSKVAS